MSVLKLENPNDVQELERLRILANKLRNWIDENGIQCSEELWQREDMDQDILRELAEMVCDDLGYYDANTQITVTVGEKIK